MPAVEVGLPQVLRQRVDQARRPGADRALGDLGEVGSVDMPVDGVLGGGLEVAQAAVDVLHLVRGGVLSPYVIPQDGSVCCRLTAFCAVKRVLGALCDLGVVVRVKMYMDGILGGGLEVAQAAADVLHLVSRSVLSPYVIPQDSFVCC